MGEPGPYSQAHLYTLREGKRATVEAALEETFLFFSHALRPMLLTILPGQGDLAEP